MHGPQMKRDQPRRKLVKTAAVGLLVALFSHPLVASGFEVKGIFDGHWEIDFARSESPSDKLRYLYDVTLSEHRRRLSASDSRLGDSPLTAMKDLRGLINLGRLGEQITRTSTLEVVSGARSLEIHRDDNFTLRCEEGSPETGITNLGLARCEWQDSQLIVRQRLPGGIGIEHRLTLSPAGRELNVATSILGQGVTQSFIINRVYVPYQPGEERFQCEYQIGKGKVCTLGAGSAS